MSTLKSFWNKLTSPGKYINRPRSSFSISGSMQINEGSAMQVAAFNRGLIYISTQIAKLPWDVKDITDRIIPGQLSNLLNVAPNREMNAFRFRLCMIQNAIIHGNAYAEIERDLAGRPIALWPLDSRQMDLTRSESGELYYVFHSTKGSPIYLEPRDVFHLPNFHTMDGLVGQGIVSYGREVLGIQIAADRMAASIFQNSGIPSGILYHPQKLSDEAFARLKESWSAQNGGTKSGSTSVLEEGMKYEPVKIDSDALQFLESREFGVLEIARFLGIPPTKLFDTKASTYSNVEQANLEVATDTLDTWATNLEMEADVKLLANRFGGRYTDIDLYSVFRGDMKSRSDYFKTMLSIGAMTPNEIRARERIPSYPQGDNFYIATNNYTPVDRMDEVIDAEITQKTKPTSAPDSKPGSDKELTEAAIQFLTK